MTTTFPLVDGVRGDAVVSPDNVYRYLLTRDWFPGGGRNAVLWVMLNPSMGDADRDDRTLRRCQDFSRRWGFDGASVVNLFALRSATPTALKTHPDPIGPENNEIIEAILGATSIKLVVAAWGRQGSTRWRDAEVIGMALRAGRELHALTLNDDGTPKHPLYVSGDVEPVLYRPT